ncbi:protein PEAK3 [Molothrus aeneus]|uniref:protein PEAK3 n=1 Tax=Molothrus aeneus TaxID=84833 RepID=UPI003458AADC
MGSTRRGWDGQQELLRLRDVQLEPRGTSLPPRTPHRASSAPRSASPDPAAPGAATPMPDTPGGCPPRSPSSALIYSNVGELRAHLVPRKASRGEGAVRPLPRAQPDPLPPPLPKKQLQRAESLPAPAPSQRCHDEPEPRAGSSLYSIPAGQGAPLRDRPSKKLLSKSQSLGEPLAPSSPQKAPSGRLKELTFGTGDGELGQLLESPAGVSGVVLGCQEASLARLSALLQEELLGPEERQQLLEAELPVLQVLLCAEVPQQTLAEFVKGSHALHRSSPGHYERLGCLLLLQLCMGLEHLRGHNVVQGDLCPENLLLVQCPCPPQRQKEPLGLSLPRLLISSFFKVQEKQRPCSSSQELDWSQALAAPSPPTAAELNLGRLIYQILHVDISLENILDFRSKRLPEIPSLSIYSAGLKRLASLLLHRDPHQRVSILQARAILQVLLWGPRQELFARSRKSLELLQSWLQVKRALLLLRFAENSAGAGVSPGLEEWLCCQYFQGVTEYTLYQVTQVLYAP